MPVGKPFGPKPLGTEIAGWPTALPAGMIGGPKPTPGYALSKTLSIGYETDGPDGATRASHRHQSTSLSLFLGTPTPIRYSKSRGPITRHPRPLHRSHTLP